eukprot:m.246956 g.246956  ORF g.246956 m.246956 type:complete len:389 (+) comp19069_c0_seq19:1193-2359(+)
MGLLPGLSGVARACRLRVEPVARLCKHSQQHTPKWHRRKSSLTSGAYTGHEAHAHLPDTVFSGIQPTGVPTLGNYLGALRAWVDLQHSTPADTPVYYCVVDLHALTNKPAASDLRQSILDTAALLLACGIDPARSILYQQSQVREHTELAWIFNCRATYGALHRMHQFKAKSEKLNETAGLLTYPVLQTADILLYKAKVVPVGDDQLQHLELSRSIAQEFNHAYGQPVFPLPVPMTMKDTARVMSLKDPTKKMSKSDLSQWSRIGLQDPPDLIRKKIRKAVTDSQGPVTYDPLERPGVSNLVTLFAASSPEYDSPEDVVQAFGSADTLEFKKELAEVVVNLLAPIQDNLVRLQQDEGFVRSVLEQGRRAAAAQAAETMEEVRSVVGIA